MTQYELLLKDKERYLKQRTQLEMQLAQFVKQLSENSGDQLAQLGIFDPEDFLLPNAVPEAYKEDIDPEIFNSQMGSLKEAIQAYNEARDLVLTKAYKLSQEVENYV